MDLFSPSVLRPQALDELKVDGQRGLSTPEALHRKSVFGENALEAEEPESLTSKFIDQLKQPLILLLFGSAFVSALVGHYDDAVSITLVRGLGVAALA